MILDYELKAKASEAFYIVQLGFYRKYGGKQEVHHIKLNISRDEQHILEDFLEKIMNWKEDSPLFVFQVLDKQIEVRKPVDDISSFSYCEVRIDLIRYQDNQQNIFEVHIL